MTKFLEAYCNAHWRESKAKVPATRADVELCWDGRRYTMDLCDEHWGQAPRRELGWLLAVADPAAPDGAGQDRPDRRGRRYRPGERTPAGQPTGEEADAIREWVKAEGIMSREDPARLAFRRRGGDGNYFPRWLMQAWDQRRARQAASLARAGGVAAAGRGGGGHGGYLQG